MIQGNGKRKECLDNDDDEAQRITVKRPALTPTVSVQKLTAMVGLSLPSGSDNEDQEKNDSSYACPIRPAASIQQVLQYTEDVYCQRARSCGECADVRSCQGEGDSGKGTT